MADRLDNAPCGFVEFADDGAILYANATLAEWLGLSNSQQLVGRKFDSILTVANRIFFQTHFFPMLTLNGGVEEIFLSLRAHDGASVPVVATAKRLPSPGGFAQPMRPRHGARAPQIRGRNPGGAPRRG